MYLRVCFIAWFGTALHFFYSPRFKTTIDLFSADKKIATRIASTSLCSMFTKVNIPFVCVTNSPLHSFGIYLRKYFVLRFGLQTQWKLCRKQIDSNELWWVRFTYKRNIFLWKISHECVITFLTELTVDSKFLRDFRKGENKLTESQNLPRNGEVIGGENCGASLGVFLRKHFIRA